ncbi:MAG: restriction endonuclease subunit S [Acidobacteria bacterium]|nr:restriction endonuclease subunit S [Acidobacteriota bacterium]
MPNFSRQSYIIYDWPATKALLSDEWEEKRLGALADVVGGGTPDTGIYGYWHPPVIPWVTPTDISACNGIYLSRTERCISDAGLRSCSATLLPAGTTLLTSRATVGECRINTVEVATNQGFASLVPREVDGNFLFYMAQHLKPVFCRLAAGTTYAEVSRREVRKVRCYLPKDKEEQKQIATLLLLADKGVQELKNQLEAAQRIKAALMQHLFTKGIPGRHTRLKTIVISRHSYSIPYEWEISKVQDVLSSPPFNGVSPQSRPDPPGTAILNVSCISDGKCDPRKASYVDVDEATIDCCRAMKGDFYVLRGNGNREYVATGGWLKDDVPDRCIFSDKLIRLSFDPSKVVDGFMPWLWQSHTFLRRLQSKAESGSGLWMMSKRDIRREVFFRPKPGEQDEIVSTLNRCESTLDAINKKIESLLRLKKSLLQNLLTGKVRVKVEAWV